MNDIDKKIGAIMRARRKQLGFSQEAVADLVGVTFQQVQKYEKGSNGMNAKRLVEFAAALKMPVERFFTDAPIVKDNASDREGLELMKAFNSIKDYLVRKRISDLVRAVAI